MIRITNLQATGFPVPIRQKLTRLFRGTPESYIGVVQAPLPATRQLRKGPKAGWSTSLGVLEIAEWQLTEAIQLLVTNGHITLTSFGETVSAPKSPPKQEVVTPPALSGPPIEAIEEQDS